jgi:mono/diheme cytochrome c family protein
MPPWPKLSDAERGDLAKHVIELQRQGIRDREKATAQENGEEFDPKAVEKIVSQITAPGAPIPTPAIVASTPESVARGKERFRKVCASCHGASGKGDGQEKMIDAEGWPDRPRDLTLGIFKGSPDPQSVYRRILSGMPGSPMPASKWTPDEVVDVLHYVLSLSDERARQSAVLNRERIVARATDRPLDSLDAAAWNRVSPVKIHTTPLWWRDDPPVDIEGRALYNGEKLAFRLSWPDPSVDRQNAKCEAFADAVAVALSHGPSEPFLGMGSSSQPVDFWFWDADRQSGLPDVEDVNPRLTVDIYPFGERTVATAEFRRPGTTADAQAKPGLPARAVGNPRSAGKGTPIGAALEAGGPGTLTFRPPVNQTVRASGTWRDGRWTVTLIGPLTAATGAAVPLKSNESLSVSFAVWDGSHSDRDGQKRISIWQDLVLEPAGR